MAKFYDAITTELRAFIEAQHIFFVATAAENSRINLSPKGMDSLRVLDDRTVAYLDLTGSGNETAAHLKADGRITVMFCSFDAAPRILRLYGRGRLILKSEPAWSDMISCFPPLPGARQIVVVEVQSVQTSCGFGVPYYEFKGERPALIDWALKKGEIGLEEYRRKYNRLSIDSLPSDTVNNF